MERYFCFLRRLAPAWPLKGPARPADDAYKHDTEENANAVDADVPDGWPASGNKGLVVFIRTGKTDTDGACDQKQRKTPESIDIKWKRYGDGQNKVFGHMSELSDGTFNAPGVGIDLNVVQGFIQNPAPGLYKLIADFVA